MLLGLRHSTRLTSTTVILLIVFCTLGLNLLTFAFTPLANLVLAAANQLAIQPVVAAASELEEVRNSEKAAQKRAAQLDMDRKAAESRIKQLRTDLDAEQRKAAKLADELTLSKSRVGLITTDLRQFRKRVEELTGELNEMPTVHRLPKTAVKHIDSLTARIVQRSGRNAARNLASMPLESIPVVGALTIVSVTALELHDACQTAAEMEELRQLVNLPNIDTSVVRNACAKMPTLSSVDDLTLSQCREHEAKVLAGLGPEAALPIKNKCDCLELPDGCPGKVVETERVPPPIPELP